MVLRESFQQLLYGMLAHARRACASVLNLVRYRRLRNLPADFLQAISESSSLQEARDCLTGALLFSVGLAIAGEHEPGIDPHVYLTAKQRSVKAQVEVHGYRVKLREVI